MKAVVIEKPGVIMYKTIDFPKLHHNEVLVKVKNAGICGTDVHILEGNFLGKYPVIPGHEFSGTVVEIGKSVSKFKLRDNVVIDPNIRCGTCTNCLSGNIQVCENYDGIGVTKPGGFAEFTKAPEQNVHKFNSDSFSSAAFVEPMACVLFGQNKLEVKPGSHVIVWGAGAIGLLHMQYCSRMRGALVTVIDTNTERLNLAKKLGAFETLKADENMNAKLRAIQPKGWSTAIDATGNVNALKNMFSYLNRAGQALVFSVYPQKDLISISPYDIFYNDWKIFGSFTYAHEFSNAVGVLAAKIIDFESLIDRTIVLKELPSTLKEMAKGKPSGKVQVEI